VFSPPLLNYSCLLYPEILAGFIGLYVFRKIVTCKKWGYSQTGFLLLLLLVLPILKIRYAPLVVLLVCTFAVMNFRLKYIFVYGIILTGLAGIVYFLDQYIMSGIIFLASYNPLNHFIRLFNTNPVMLVKGFIAFFIDQEFGLFWTAPIYFFILPGIAKIWKTDLKWVLLIVVIYPFILVPLKKLGLHSLDTPPPPRFLVCILPFYGIILARGIYNMGWAGKQLFRWLLMLTCLFTCVRWSLFRGFSEFVMGRNSVIAALDCYEHFHLQRFFPAIFRNHTEFWQGMLLFIILFVLILAIYCILWRNIKIKDTNNNITFPYLTVVCINALCLTGLSLLVLYQLEKHIPVHAIEAEEMVHYDGNYFPGKLDWWERNWNNWESQDVGRELYPGNRTLAYLNFKNNFPDTITIAANRTAVSSQVPRLKIYLCDQFVKENVHSSQELLSHYFVP